ncbi:hypothetical protein VPH35_010906 [Triticum aestivum]
MEFLTQPNGRSALLEEVGESFVPGPQVGIGGALAETVVSQQHQPAMPQQHVPAANGEAQIWSTKEDGAARRESSPPTSKLSTRKMNPRLSN